MAKQGRLIETMATNELDRRRKRLEEYQIKARFALAESYDRATKAQLDAEIAKQQQALESAEAAPAAAEEAVSEEPQQAVEEQTPAEADEAEQDEVGGRSSFKQQLLGR